MVYSVPWYISRGLARVVRLVLWRRVRMLDCFFGGYFGGMVRVGLFCLLSLGVEGGGVMVCM